jgi:hypothetical protein
VSIYVISGRRSGFFACHRVLDSRPGSRISSDVSSEEVADQPVESSPLDVVDSRKTHDFTDLSAIFGFEAVGFAFSAVRLRIEGAAIETPDRVVEEFAALWAESVFFSFFFFMVFFTKNAGEALEDTALTGIFFGNEDTLWFAQGYIPFLI